MRTSLRLSTAAAVMVLAGAGAVALLGGFERKASSAEAPGLDPLLPGYPGTHLFGLGESLAMEGVPVKVGYFSSPSATPSEIADYYARFWGSHGLPTTLRDGDDAAQASGFDDATHLMRSVAVVRRGGRVVAFVSIVPLDGAPVASAGDLPTAPGAALLQRTGSREGGHGNASLTYVLRGDLHGARDAVVKAFTDQGWSLARERAQTELTGLALRLAKGPRRALVTLVEAPGSQVVGVEAHVTDASEVSR